MLRLSVTLPGSYPSNSNIAVFCFEKSKKAVGTFLFGSPLDKALLEAQKDGFEGKLGQVAVVHSRKSSISRYIIAGLGAEAEPSLETVRRAVSALVRKASSLHLRNLTVRPPQIGGAQATAQAAVEGALLSLYRYTEFKSEKNPDFLQTFVLIAKDATERQLYAKGLALGETFAGSTNFARDLINRPPSDATPEFIVQAAKKLAGRSVQVKIFNKAQIERLGMGALLGVNRGSGKPPYFLHFVYKPHGKPKRKIGICGKGITFDSGGLSLKPAKSMETMKYDMAGAATVLSLFRALPKLNLPIEVHGFTPLTENMPGCNAVKPGDVLRTLRGKTIEVLNTDAEGRLVLSDALSYGCRQGLDEILDVATLTGACVVALGNKIAGILGNNPSLIARLKAASDTAGEKLWELPLESEYEGLLKSDVADIKNIGPVGEAGTILGGLFLSAFVDKGMPWAHLDIASTAWTNSPTALSDTGATGVIVRTLLEYLMSYN